MDRSVALKIKNKRTLAQKLGYPKGFKYEFFSTLIICPKEAVNPEIVATIIGRVDHQVMMHNHWVSQRPTSSLKIWGGAVAEFSCITQARIAAESLQRESM